MVDLLTEDGRSPHAPPPPLPLANLSLPWPARPPLPPPPRRGQGAAPLLTVDPSASKLSSASLATNSSASPSPASSSSGSTQSRLRPGKGGGGGVAGHVCACSAWPQAAAAASGWVRMCGGQPGAHRRSIVARKRVQHAHTRAPGETGRRHSSRPLDPHGHIPLHPTQLLATAAWSWPWPAQHTGHLGLQLPDTTSHSTHHQPSTTHHAPHTTPPPRLWLLFTSCGLVALPPQLRLCLHPRLDLVAVAHLACEQAAPHVGGLLQKAATSSRAAAGNVCAHEPSRAVPRATSPLRTGNVRVAVAAALPSADRRSCSMARLMTPSSLPLSRKGMRGGRPAFVAAGFPGSFPAVGAATAPVAPAAACCGGFACCRGCCFGFLATLAGARLPPLGMTMPQPSSRSEPPSPPAKGFSGCGAGWVYAPWLSSSNSCDARRPMALCAGLPAGCPAAEATSEAQREEAAGGRWGDGTAGVGLPATGSGRSSAGSIPPCNFMAYNWQCAQRPLPPVAGWLPTVVVVATSCVTAGKGGKRGALCNVIGSERNCTAG